MDPELFDHLRALAEGKAPKANGSGVAIVLPLDAEDAEALALEGGLPPDELHCTLAYLGSGDDVTDAQVEAAKEVLAAWAEGRAPIPARVGCIGRFPGSEDEGDPVYLPVDAPRLTLERSALVRALRDAKAPPSDDHGFNAHITVSYVPVEDDLPVQRVEPREVKFTRVELWARGEHFTYPLESDYDTPEKAHRDGPKTETHAMRPDVLQEMIRLASTPSLRLAEADAGPQHQGMKMVFGTWRKADGRPAATPEDHQAAAKHHKEQAGARTQQARNHVRNAVEAHGKSDHDGARAQLGHAMGAFALAHAHAKSAGYHDKNQSIHNSEPADAAAALRDQQARDHAHKALTHELKAWGERGVAAGNHHNILPKAEPKAEPHHKPASSHLPPVGQAPAAVQRSWARGAHLGQVSPEVRASWTRKW